MSEQKEPRWVPILNGLILAAITATLGIVYKTDRNVVELRAQMDAATAIEQRDPVIRERQYKSDKLTIDARFDGVDMRLRRLETARHE